MKVTLWRTTVFRLTLSYAVGLATALMVLMGVMYWKSTEYFSRIGDTFVVGQASALVRVPPWELPRELSQLQMGDIRGIARYGLFSREGKYLAGNIQVFPRDLPLDGEPRPLRAPGYEPGARAAAQRLPDGQILVTGYDAKTLSGIGDMLLELLLWAGTLSLAGGLVLGAILGLRPLRRVREVQVTSRRIADGDLSQRLPLSGRGDELDALSSLVNQMMDEVEHLLAQVRSVGNNLAHDLRTPLNRLRANLHRLIEDYRAEAPDQLMPRLYQSLEATDQLLSRFRAIQRIAEIDSRDRRSAMKIFHPESLIENLSADFKPVAEDLGVTFLTYIEQGPPLWADEELLTEALINLLDNALKFTPSGGIVCLQLRQQEAGPILAVQDTGPGIPADQREHVLLRFGRCARDQQVAGGGLGLAIVTAITRLHDYKLNLKDARPGLRAEIHCTAAVAG